MPLSRLDVLKVDECNRMIDVNIRGVLHGIAAALPVMQRQRSGQLVNIAAIGAHSVVPIGAVYCATKYAVRAISEGLRQEVRSDIRVTLVSLGVVESELAESISDESSREAMKAFRKVVITPDAIARAIAYALKHPADVDVGERIVRPTASHFRAQLFEGLATASGEGIEETVSIGLHPGATSGKHAVDGEGEYGDRQTLFDVHVRPAGAGR